MCTRTIQDEVRKRREVLDALRPLLAAYVKPPEDAPVGTVAHVAVVYGLIETIIPALGLRRCCVTFPGEAHGSRGYPCALR